MEYRRVPIGHIHGNEVIEKPQRVEHGCLHVCNERCAGEDIGVPEGEGSVRPELFIDEVFPGKKLKDEVRSEKRFVCDDGAGQEEDSHATQYGKSKRIPCVL